MASRIPRMVALLEFLMAWAGSAAPGLRRLGSARSEGWWVPERPQEEETQCLFDHKFGCNVIKVKEVCLGSKDGRAELEINGLKIHGEPCVWCGGITCTTSSASLCEPFDYVMHGEGTAFHAFNPKFSFSVAKCKDGNPEIEIGTVSNQTFELGTALGVSSVNVSSVSNPAMNATVSESPVVATHEGQDCWYKCGEKGGFCDFCGQDMACCKTGYLTDPSECSGVRTGLMRHECVVVTSTKQATSNRGIAVPSLFPSITLAPTDGKDCWFECQEKGGFCDFCGSGMACCKTGYPTDPPECRNARTGLMRHECVPVPSNGTLAPEEGKDCWYECGEKGGFCDYCGQGMACCKTGYDADPAECSNAKTGLFRHECVVVPPTTTTLALPATPAVSTTTAASVTTAKQLGPGEDCWFQCGEKGGFCTACGAGKACCKSGYSDDPEECHGTVMSKYLVFHHECVTTLTSTSALVPAVLMPVAGVETTSAAPGNRSLPTGDCFDECQKKTGWCDYCGAGAACCKQGLVDSPPECNGAKTSVFHHECVLSIASSTRPECHSDSPIDCPTSSTTSTSFVLPFVPPSVSNNFTVVNESNNTFCVNETNFTDGKDVTLCYPKVAAACWSIPGWVWLLLALLCLLSCLVPLLLRLLGYPGGRRGKRAGWLPVPVPRARAELRQDEEESDTSTDERKLEPFLAHEGASYPQQDVVHQQQGAAYQQRGMVYQQQQSLAYQQGGAYQVQTRQLDGMENRVLLFDAIDRNHDGVISRSELAQAMGGQQVVTFQTAAQPMMFTTAQLQPSMFGQTSPGLMTQSGGVVQVQTTAIQLGSQMGRTSQGMQVQMAQQGLASASVMPQSGGYLTLQPSYTMLPGLMTQSGGVIEVQAAAMQLGSHMGRASRGMQVQMAQQGLASASVMPQSGGFLTLQPSYSILPGVQPLMQHAQLSRPPFQP